MMQETARNQARQSGGVSSSNIKRRRRRVCDRSIMMKTATMWLTIFSTLVTTLLGLALAQAISQVVVVDSNNGLNATSSRHQIQATFSTPSQAVNITHLTYDPVHDTVYVGATNSIYQLSGVNLSMQHVDSTGPVLDSPSCGITDCHGYEELMKPTSNVNKLLVLDYQHQKVLSCGSTKQGACRRYQLNNLAQKEDLIPVAVAANDDNSSTYAFVGPARYNLDQASYPLPLNNQQPQQQQQLLQQQQQQVLYVASTYTKVGQSRDLLVPAIGTRTLDHGPNLMKLYEKSFLDSARIDISSHLRDYFLVHYLYGFASSNYIYFVTVQKKATSRDYEELGYHTRLARICITDSSYNSYTEVDLKCVANKKRSAMAPTSSSRHPSFFGTLGSQQQQQQQVPSEYPLLQDAILVDAGSQLLQSINANSGDFYYPPASSTGAQSDDSKVLLGVFSSARDHTQHPGEHSALCAFSLAQIEEKFNDNIHNCYTGKMQSRNMEYIAGNVQECPKNGRGGNVVDFCHETLKINGTIPITSEASIQYQNTTLTAITATSHVNTNQRNIYSDQLGAELASSTLSARASYLQGANPYTVAFLGTSNGHIKKVLLNNATNGVEFEDVQLDTQPILADLHLHSSGQQLIAATPYKVMKVATHNCTQYSTCRDCNQSRNPYCGWCSLKRSCTTRNECVPGPEQQQPMAKSSQQTLDTSGTNSNNKQLKWISNDSAGKCIDLQAIVPDKMPISSTGKLDLYIERLPTLPKEHSYKCIFDRKEPTTATFKPFGLSCPLPKLMHRPSIPVGRDHAIVDLAVRSSETNTDFLNGKITFFECQAHKTCKDCLTTNWDCGWCLSENICLSNTSKCEKTAQDRQGPITTTLAPLVSLGAGRSSLVMAGQRSGNTIKSLHQCPTFDVGHEQSILIADGSERELAIKVKNMPHVKGNIQCYVEIENDKIPLRARIEEDRVVCENSTYTYAADVPQLQGQLVVSYSEQNILIDRTNFTLYKCHLLGAYLNRPDCSLCQRISSRFQCGWCSGACMHRSRCTERPDDTCPPPRIDYVHPLNGPIQGGTRVLIEGSNLGQSIEEVANRVKIGNVPCKLVEDEYRPSNRIVCITGPLITRYFNNKQPLVEMESSLGDVMVGNRAGYSVGPNKFHFKSVYLRDHQPKYGPQSGGTRITLSGLNLNIGSSVQVFLDELPCQIEPNQVTSEQIICKTSPSPQPSRQIRQLKLIVDDLQIIQDDEVFYYIQDPTISKISPLRSYLSGGRPITVYGSNLTSVQLPRMVISDVVTGKQINETTCLFLDDTRMRCPSPVVSLPMIELEYSEQHLPQNQQQQHQTIGLQLADGESVKFKLNIVMDNVMPAMNVVIEYTSDPKLYSFDSQQYKNSSGLAHDQDQPQQGQEQAAYQLDSDTYLLQPTEPMLTLYGEHLQTAVNEYEITVFVGQDVCNLTYWSHTKLVCAMPLDHMASPTDEEARLTQRGLPLVVVRIGYNLRYELGYVMYHPQLADQIRQTQANSSGNRITQLEQHYRNYIPRENESFLRRIPGYVMTILLFLLYVTLGTILVGLVYASSFLVHKIKKKSYYEHEYRRIQSKMDSLEKSIKTECRVASLALQGDLNELERHVDLSGVPLLTVKQYIMKVFFPGINNHPLLVKSNPQNEIHHNNCMLPEAANATNHQNHLMASIQRPLKSGATTDFPMDYFHRLILNKPFLIIFINTLEAQPSFTIRDKVNVASLIMIILMERLDYATDILRTLLFQLVERSASRDRQLESTGTLESRLLQGKQRTLSHKANNLIGGLPSATGKRSLRSTTLGKVVNGNASSLMTSTTVAAQMLLSRVGNKTSPLQENVNANLKVTATMGHNMSTTTFNQRNHHNGPQNQRSMMQSYSSTLGKTIKGGPKSQTHLMLRRTDSVVEKMLTNWLALNMYDYFHGKIGQSLYMMFEALRCQLDRGPIESVSGDAYYSLNEHKLLKEPYIQFEMVNLYIIVDTDILQPHKTSSDQNLLLDGTPNYQMQFYEDNRSNYTTSNTITLSLRVLDCDTINQVKGKILNALYRNSPNSMRLTVNDVELSLRQQQMLTGQSTLNGGQYVTVTLHDEDYSSVTAFNGSKRLNTLRHYGVTDQAIMMLNRINQLNDRRLCSTSVTRTNLTDMLDEHYNNPYSEIQYGPIGARHANAAPTNSTKWHLVRPDERGLNMQQINGHSNESSPSSQSPSMLLLGNESAQPRQQQQQFYHPSSSSTGSTGTGNVMDTHSTSANSSSMNVGNLLMRTTRQEQQPIYCQIGSVSGTSGRQAANGGSSSYYCQINNCNQSDYQVDHSDLSKKIDREQEQRIYLTRMMTSKGTVQSYIDNFFKTILSAKGDGSTSIDYNNMNNVLCGDFSGTTQGAKGARNSGACPPAVKWLFDLLDEAAMENGITDPNVIHQWKSNAFLLRFWANFIKNPNYILDVEKSNTLDASLSVISQTLMDSCSSGEHKLSKDSTCDKLLFAKDVPKYKGQVKRFYQDIASMRSVSDQEIVKQMGQLSMNNAGQFDTNLALKELCVYAVNYGVELMSALNNDFACQQLDLSQQLEQCFRSFAIFEAYQ